ncbi:DUF1842 domain-containing protein [Micromonospora sp. CPCC 206061]|uniref:DUF1842 domain-containing protein n=1 Tax=Micromonospora sp. CPCC 206061 TaxID=3122410 RepID=UPI002FF2B8A0
MSTSATRAKGKAPSATPKTEARSGLFIGSWEIGSRLIGAPLLTVHLTFDAPSGAVSGIGQLAQPTSPPMHQSSRLDGDYTYLTVMPNTSHILITLTGYPVLWWPSNGGVGPVLMPNLRLRMVLEADWQSGTANFEYLDADGTWQRVESAQAQMLSNVDVAGQL